MFVLKHKLSSINIQSYNHIKLVYITSKTEYNFPIINCDCFSKDVFKAMVLCSDIALDNTCINGALNTH